MAPITHCGVVSGFFKQRVSVISLHLSYLTLCVFLNVTAYASFCSALKDEAKVS